MCVCARVCVCVCRCRQTAEWTPPHGYQLGFVRREGKNLVYSPFPHFFLPLLINKLLKIFFFLVVPSEKFYNTFLCERSDKSLIKKILKRTSMAPFFLLFFAVSFASKIFPLCWLRKARNGMMLNWDVKKMTMIKIRIGDAYKVDIDNGITKIKICVMVRNKKKWNETRSKERVRVVMQM